MRRHTGRFNSVGIQMTDKHLFIEKLREALNWRNSYVDVVHELFLPDTTENTVWNKAIHTAWRAVQLHGRELEDQRREISVGLDDWDKSALHHANSIQKCWDKKQPIPDGHALYLSKYVLHCLQKKPEPVSVSLLDIAGVICRGVNDETKDYKEIAKAVLDAAGVKYVE
ncbi:MAG TPA: hypothetical protein VFE62_26185 [Gemmataceae bacterium]|nr:hypothetical protein [Gemmataceae bacterium]